MRINYKRIKTRKFQKITLPSLLCKKTRNLQIANICTPRELLQILRGIIHSGEPKSLAALGASTASSAMFFSAFVA